MDISALKPARRSSFFCRVVRYVREILQSLSFSSESLFQSLRKPNTTLFLVIEASRLLLLLFFCHCAASASSTSSSSHPGEELHYRLSNISLPYPFCCYCAKGTGVGAAAALRKYSRGRQAGRQTSEGG